MIYDKLLVALLSTLSSEPSGSTNALIAQYLLDHAKGVESLSVKQLAAACHVGTGTISRFAREAGFLDFADLRAALARTTRSYEAVDGGSFEARAHALGNNVRAALVRSEESVDRPMLARLVQDLRAYHKVSAFGLLKAQAAAIDLQVDLLMQGKYVETKTSLAEQRAHIATARSDELIIIFSYTGSYFDACELGDALRRIDRPRIWMVCGTHRSLPAYVYGQVTFSSDLGQLGHPYSLQLVSSLIAQEYAALPRDEAANPSA